MILLMELMAAKRLSRYEEKELADRNQIRISDIIVNRNGKIQSPEQFMLESGDSRQAFPDNGGKEKATELSGMFNGVLQD